MAFDIKKSLAGLKKKAEKTFNVTKKGGKKKLALLIASVIGVLFVVFIGVMSYGIYVKKWEDSFTKGVTKVLPFPAATIDGKYVSYHSYIENVDILKKYNKEFKKIDFNSEDGKKLLESIRKDTLNRLVESVIIQKEAKNLNVKLSKKDIDDSFNDLINSNGGPKSFADVLDRYYGLSTDEFKEQIYEDRLLRQKVADKFSNDDNINSDAKKKAEEILAKVKAGEDFAELAKQNSQDNTAANGGDLGLFGKGKMVPEFEKVAFSLKEGETSDIVKTVYGYHIIKVTDVQGDQIKASHILIKTKDFSTWLEDTKKSVKVWPGGVKKTLGYGK